MGERERKREKESLRERKARERERDSLSSSFFSIPLFSIFINLFFKDFNFENSQKDSKKSRKMLIH